MANTNDHPINPQITDSVTQTDAKVLLDAKPVDMGQFITPAQLGALNGANQQSQAPAPTPGNAADAAAQALASLQEMLTAARRAKE